MGASVRWDGLDELRAALRNLPQDLADGAGAIVLASANEAKESIDYPRRTGDLADHLKVQTINAGQYGAAAVLKNTSKLAHIYEYGSHARHTAIGAFRGSMPPAQGRRSFVAMAIRARTRMYDKLRELLVRNGATVSGEP